MSFVIVEQEESIGKGETRPVFCKHLKWFPKNTGPDRQVELGRITFPCLRVVISEVGTGKVLVLSWSNYRRQPLSNPNCGKFKITWPAVMRTPLVTTRVKNIDQWWADEVEIKGESTEFEIHARFKAEIARFCGPELADDIMAAFYERIVEILTAKAA